MTVSQTEPSQKGLYLPGLDGTNPLGFLAALGVLRVLTRADQRQEPVRMSWEQASGTWVARLFSSATNKAALLDLLDGHLIATLDQHPLGPILALDHMDPGSRKDDMRSRVYAATNRGCVIADWLAAMVSDAVSAGMNSQLQTVRRDYFPDNLKSVIERTEQRHLKRSLFRIWDYGDALDNQSLHVDPSEDRRHAHQWNKPSGDLDRKRSGGMLGANRLAVEALPIFVSLPERDRLHTLGFSGFRSDDTRWTWPLWRHPIDLETTRSLLALEDIQREEVSGSSLSRLRARGVVAVVRTRRILVGKTPNFTPTQTIG